MDAQEFLFRALGVPGILTPPGRVESAAARLLTAADLGESELWPTRPGHLRASTVAVLETITRHLSSGALDGFLGGFAAEELAVTVPRVAGDVMAPPEVSGHSLSLHGEALVHAALLALQALCTKRPELGWSQP